MSRTSVQVVSVGMPVFNGEHFLPQAIVSILGQTFANLELVISDNASTDGTEEICQSYARTDKRVRYFRNSQNLGAAWNYNRVFRLSQGRYFKWAAADDVCSLHYLERCVPILEASSDVVLCYGRTRLIDEQGKALGDYDDRLDLRDDSPAGRFVGFLRSVRECNAVFGVIRRSVLAGTSLIGSYVGSDRWLLGELSLRGEFVEIPEYLFYRRVHPRASSSNKSLEA